MYEWQDMREIRANALLNHYVKELNIPYIFNQGFMDAMAIGEEIY
nr:MAG TPA: portal protein [Bacteriophage sp.]